MELLQTVDRFSNVTWESQANSSIYCVENIEQAGILHKKVLMPELGREIAELERHMCRASIGHYAASPFLLKDFTGYALKSLISK